MVLSSSKEKWIHPHETLINGKVTYHVKFVGMTEVVDPRGMDVVRDALQKLKFTRHIKRSEGTKPPKVDLTINVHGMKIIDQHTKLTLHDIPLHRVSFCADDKQDKRIFSFIAKGHDGKHYCYGLDSLHESNNITLTIGQAFELAYDKFLKNDKATSSKQVLDLSKRIELLERENSTLKERILQLESPENSTSPTTPTSPSSEKLDQNSLFNHVTPIHQPTNQCEPSTHSLPSTSQGTPELSIFNESSLSHSPSNQKYLESKLTSRPEGNMLTRQIQKQAYIDQTIASVERAKVSLKNLKEFVKQRKLRRKEKCDMNTTTANSHPYKRNDATFNTIPRMSQNKSEKDFDSTATTVVEATNATVSTQSNSGIKLSTVQLRKNKTDKPNIEKLGKRNSSESLYTGIHEVMDTIQRMMHHDTKAPPGGKPSESKVSIDNCSTAPTSNKKVMSETDLPETVIGDSINVNSSDYGNYTNLSFPSDKVNTQVVSTSVGDKPPPIPPKPKSLTEASSVDSSSMRSESLCSVSSSEASSLDTLSGLSFTLWTPDNYMNQDMQSTSSTRSIDEQPSSQDRISTMLDRFAGEEGYMELKAVKDLSQGTEDPLVDTMYDNVHKLMEAIRGEACREEPKKMKKITNPKTKSKNQSNLTDPNYVMQLLKQGNIDRQGNSPVAKQIPPLLSDPSTGKVGFMPVVSRGITLVNSRHSKPMYSTSDLPQFSSNPPQYSKINRRDVQSNSMKSEATDVFDMQPFSLAPSPFVKLPSPDQVHPPKIPARQRFSSKSKDDFGQQLFDPLDELSQLNHELRSMQSSSSENRFEMLQRLLNCPNLPGLLALSEKMNQTTQNTSNIPQDTLKLPETQGIDTPQHSAAQNTPTSSRNNKSSGKKDGDFRRKLRILEEGFSKGLTTQEAELSLDAFDPLKTNH